MTIEDSQLANFLRNEILKSPSKMEKVAQKADISDLEMVSQTQKPYVSPIMSMSEDEIVAFVEEFDINELATLSDEELDRMSEVLGVDSENPAEKKN